MMVYLFMGALSNGRNDCGKKLTAYRIADPICLLLNSADVTFLIVSHMGHMYLCTFCPFGQFCPYTSSTNVFSHQSCSAQVTDHSVRQLATAHKSAFNYISCKMCYHMFCLVFCLLWGFLFTSVLQGHPSKGLEFSAAVHKQCYRAVQNQTLVFSSLANQSLSWHTPWGYGCMLGTL